MASEESQSVLGMDGCTNPRVLLLWMIFDLPDGTVIIGRSGSSEGTTGHDWVEQTVVGLSNPESTA
jgi:hypothetical protein